MALEKMMAAGHDDDGGRAGHATFRQDTLSVDDESAHPDVAITTPRGAVQSGDTKKTPQRKKLSCPVKQLEEFYELLQVASANLTRLTGTDIANMPSRAAQINKEGARSQAC